MCGGNKSKEFLYAVKVVITNSKYTRSFQALPSGCLQVLNLYALRATTTKELWHIKHTTDVQNKEIHVGMEQMPQDFIILPRSLHNIKKKWMVISEKK